MKLIEDAVQAEGRGSYEEAIGLYEQVLGSAGRECDAESLGDAIFNLCGLYVSCMDFGFVSAEKIPSRVHERAEMMALAVAATGRFLLGNRDYIDMWEGVVFSRIFDDSCRDRWRALYEMHPGSQWIKVGRYVFTQEGMSDEEAKAWVSSVEWSKMAGVAYLRSVVESIASHPEWREGV